MDGKNIVLCSDGTGNIAIKGRGTNVFKLYEAVDIQSHTYDPRLTPQVAVYGDGIGTAGHVFMKWLASAFAIVELGSSLVLCISVSNDLGGALLFLLGRLAGHRISFDSRM
ncbi:MAG: hypothetical protein OJF51_001094 [Nitrospira sp.]|jgi:uncharacterized protein (DUF2235 family)|nr:MAG: hypothetical protein OJF51_001094 [Nitrospira sp.]